MLFTWNCKSLQEGKIVQEDADSCGGFVTKSFRKQGTLQRSRQWEISLHSISSENPEVFFCKM